MRNLIAILILNLLLSQQATGSLRCATNHAEVAAKLTDLRAETTFVVENPNKYPITITAVTTSCSCTTAEPNKKTIQPGEKASVKVAMELGKHVGKTRKTITIETDDQVGPSMELSFTVLIPEPLEITPRIINWADGDTRSPRIITIKSIVADPINVTEVTADDPNLKTELKVTQEGMLYELIVWPYRSTRSKTAILTVKAAVGKKATEKEAFIDVVAAAAPATQPEK